MNISNRTKFDDSTSQGGDNSGIMTPGVAGFGYVISQSNWPREIQLGMKLTF